MDQMLSALALFSVSKMGDISLGRSVGAAWRERRTAASALGKKDARWPLAGVIESSAYPRNDNEPEPHHLEQRDLDEVCCRSRKGLQDRG